MEFNKFEDEGLLFNLTVFFWFPGIYLTLDYDKKLIRIFGLLINFILFPIWIVSFLIGGILSVILIWVMVFKEC